VRQVIYGEDPQETDDRRAQSGNLVLRLYMGTGQPFSGILVLPGDADGVPFHGWIEFMLIINSLRAHR
jgi:hypothetical protein